MKTIKINGKTFLPSAMPKMDYWDSFSKWETIEWNGHILTGKMIENPSSTMTKKELKLINEFCKFFAKENSSYVRYGASAALHDKRREQRKRILNNLGPRPFTHPKSLWESHANLDMAVILPKDDYRVPYLRNAGFEVLPWPMFFGMYHDDYTEVRVSLKRNNNGIIIG